MSARLGPGHLNERDRFSLFAGVPAQAAAERASQLTVTSAGPVPPDHGIASASRALWLAEGTGKMPRAGQGRPAERFCPPSS